MKLHAVSIALLALAAAACAPTPAPDAPVVRAHDPLRACPAAKYESYIGRNRSTLPPQPADETWRVTCTTCPVTMDYKSGRVNILYDQATGVIREVKCG
jgi:hypothetical protein